MHRAPWRSHKRHCQKSWRYQAMCLLQTSLSDLPSFGRQGHSYGRSQIRPPQGRTDMDPAVSASVPPCDLRPELLRLVPRPSSQLSVLIHSCFYFYGIIFWEIFTPNYVTYSQAGPSNRRRRRKSSRPGGGGPRREGSWRLLSLLSEADTVGPRMCVGPP